MARAKKIAILGSTGSIGQNTLDVARRYPDRFRIVALAAGKNRDLFRRQAEEFRPRCISLAEERDMTILKQNLSYSPKAFWGEDGLSEMVSSCDADLVVSSLVGAIGLAPTLAAIRSGKNIALANKEVLVMAGRLIIEEARRHKVNLLPIDSEHSAIFQSIAGHRREDIKRLILTASGGPFLNMPLKRLSGITPEDALRHPKWKMGKKITIDSATLMNKGLEVIEAVWFFGVKPEKIAVHIHPQSVVHSMVEYVDGSIVAQLGPADMKGPIAYALSYPDERLNCGVSPLDLCRMGELTFTEPDEERFPALRLAYNAIEEGSLMPVVLNAADEVAVEAFLLREIAFTDITDIVRYAMEEYKTMQRAGPTPFRQNKPDDAMAEIFEVDRWARTKAKGMVEMLKDTPVDSKRRKAGV